MVRTGRVRSRAVPRLSLCGEPRYVALVGALDQPRWVARGLGYTTTIAHAVDPLEAVDEETQSEITRRAHRDWQRLMQRRWGAAGERARQAPGEAVAGRLCEVGNKSPQRLHLPLYDDGDPENGPHLAVDPPRSKQVVMTPASQQEAAEEAALSPVTGRTDTKRTWSKMA